MDSRISVSASATLRVQHSHARRSSILRFSLRPQRVLVDETVDREHKVRPGEVSVVESYVESRKEDEHGRAWRTGFW